MTPSTYGWLKRGIVFGLSLMIAATGWGQNIRFSSRISNEQRDLIRSDLKTLQKFKFQNQDENLKKVLEVSHVSPTSLLGWLTERVQFIVEDSFDLAASVRIQNNRYIYPFPELLPAVSEKRDTDIDSSTQMANIGAAVYLVGKMDGALLSIRVPGHGNIPVKSPRVGVLKIGQSFFESEYSEVGLSSREDQVIVRLGTLFHEARHSDGNGRSLAFVHTICPEGHVFEGIRACDFSLNGSYSVGAEVLKVLTENCKTCTVMQKEMLRLRYLDSYSRVITEKSYDETQDDIMPSLIATKESCEYLERVSSESMPSCQSIDEQIEKARSGNPETMRATFVDTKPEYAR